MRERAKLSNGSLKQGVWRHSPPETIGYLVFEVSKSKVQSTFDGFLKEGNKMYACIIEAGGVVSATPQRYKFFICYSIPEPKGCLIFELSKSKEHMYI